jgi:hypothetical protein
MSTNTLQGTAFRRPLLAGYQPPVRRRDLIAREHQQVRQQAHDDRVLGRRRMLAAAVILPSLAGGVLGVSQLAVPTLAQAATVAAAAQTGESQTSAGGASYTDAATGQVWSLNAFTGQVTTGSSLTFDVNAKNTIGSPATLTLLSATGSPTSHVEDAAGTFTLSGGTVVFQSSQPGTATAQYSYTELSGKNVTATLTVTVADPTWQPLDLGVVAQGASASADVLAANPGDLTDTAHVVLRNAEGTAGGSSLATSNGTWAVGADNHTVTFTANADATPGAQDQVIYGIQGSEVTGTATATIALPAPPDNGGGDQDGGGTDTGNGGGGSTNPDHGGGSGSGTDTGSGGSTGGSTGGSGSGTGTKTDDTGTSGTGGETTPVAPPVVAPTITPAESITSQALGSTLDTAAAPGGLLTAQAGQSAASAGALDSDRFAAASQGAALTATGENPTPETSTPSPTHHSPAKQSKHAQMEVSSSPVSHPAQAVWLWVSSLGLAIAVAAVGLIVFFRRRKTGGQRQ